MAVLSVELSGRVDDVATSVSCLLSLEHVGCADDEDSKDVLWVEAVLTVIVSEAKEGREGMLDLVEVPDSLVLGLLAPPVFVTL